MNDRDFDRFDYLCNLFVIILCALVIITMIAGIWLCIRASLQAERARSLRLDPSGTSLRVSEAVDRRPAVAACNAVARALFAL